jgi:hypothetical protein
MKAAENNPIKNREELKNKRKVLFKLFLRNPMYTSLAVEIKALDDQLADWTHLLALLPAGAPSAAFRTLWIEIPSCPSPEQLNRLLPKVRFPGVIRRAFCA